MNLQNFGAWCRQLFLGPTGPTGDPQRKFPPARTSEPNSTKAREELFSSKDPNRVDRTVPVRDLPADEEAFILRGRNGALQGQLEKLPERNQARQGRVVAPRELGHVRDQDETLPPPLTTRSESMLAQDGTGEGVLPGDRDDTLQGHLDALRGKNEELKRQIANLRTSVQEQRSRVVQANERSTHVKDLMKERLTASADQIANLRTSVQEQRSRVVQANERSTHVKDLMKERLTASADQIAKLRTSLQEQRSRVVQANERTAQVKAVLKERSLLYQDKLATSREKLLLKSSVYDAARRYYGIYRQGFLFDEVAKSDVDFGADAYLCLLPSTVPAGLSLSRLKGGRVYCDCVENVEVHKHSLAPRIHPPTLELVNLAAFGSLMAVDGILTVGNAMAKTLKRFGPPIHVVPNFRRFEQPIPANELREACGLGPEDRLLFASGNVVVGFEPVVRAMAALPPNVHLAAFVKLKPADYEAIVMKEIADLGLSDRIHFFDFVEYSRLASLAADADVGLITSDVSNPNGAVALPNRLFDYLTAGLPVIAPPMPDVVDIVREHGFGKTLEQVTADNWTEAITEVLRDRHIFKAAALEARRVLTWENGEDDLIEFLGNPRSVTLIGFRDLSRYQRFLRVAQTLTSRGIRVKALFLSDDPAPVRTLGGELYHFSDRYGLGDGPVRVRHER